MESGPFRVLRGHASAIIGGPQFGMPALRSRDMPPRCDRLGLCGLGTAHDLPSAPRHSDEPDRDRSPYLRYRGTIIVRSKRALAGSSRPTSSRSINRLVLLRWHVHTSLSPPSCQRDCGSPIFQAILYRGL